MPDAPPPRPESAALMLRAAARRSTVSDAITYRHPPSSVQSAAQTPVQRVFPPSARARSAAGDMSVPVDATVVGIVDDQEIDPGVLQ